MIQRSFFIPICLMLMVQWAICADFSGTDTDHPGEPGSSLSLSRCIDIALEHNQTLRISKLAVDTAEYQYQQALSAFWPQVIFESAYNQLDEDVNFVFPERRYNYDMTLPPALGGGALSGQTTVPEQEVTVMDRQSLLSRLNMTYPLFTGGLRTSASRAAGAKLQAAKQAKRRSALALVRDVQRMYFGVVLAQRLSAIGERTLTRLETTTGLTERLYKEGSGAVSKLDYLRAKVVLDSARAIVEQLTANVVLARTALGNTMGLAWDTPVTLSETTIPQFETETDLDQLVADVYHFNPDWKQLAAALDAASALVDKERSGRWPKVTLQGTLWRWDSDLDNRGLATRENKDGWSVGLGLQVPIFTGFLTTHKIKAAKANLKQLASQQILLREGLALQVKDGFVRLNHSGRIREAARQAADHAREHRELAVEAYMSELISTEKVIESQILEALASARSEIAQYENALARFDIDFIVGREMSRLMDADS